MTSSSQSSDQLAVGDDQARPAPRRCVRAAGSRASAIVDGRFVVPTIVTPLSTISSPGRVSSQLPPVSAARSTITEPARIARTASAVISFGAGRPGIAAVVITASNCGIRACSSACWAACCSARQLARVAALGLLADERRGRGTSRRATRPVRAPPGARRTPDTTAPRRRAVAIACSPATPAPSTSTFAGGIVPAAVISIGKKRGSRSAAISAAL